MKKRKPTTKPKATHYQVKWDIIESLEIIEAYEKQHGKVENIPYSVQKKMYQGNLLDAVHFGKISPLQSYGVKFMVRFSVGDDPTIIYYERSFRIREPMTLKELIDGCSRVDVDMGDGITVKGWKGASRAWLDDLEREYGNDILWHMAKAEANCMVK